jgi:hypothetical protein
MMYARGITRREKIKQAKEPYKYGKKTGVVLGSTSTTRVSESNLHGYDRTYLNIM